MDHNCEVTWYSDIHGNGACFFKHALFGTGCKLDVHGALYFVGWGIFLAWDESCAVANIFPHFYILNHKVSWWHSFLNCSAIDILCTNLLLDSMDCFTLCTWTALCWSLALYLMILLCTSQFYLFMNHYDSVAFLSYSVIPSLLQNVNGNKCISVLGCFVLIIIWFLMSNFLHAG